MIALFLKFLTKIVLMLWAASSYAQVDGTPNGAANVAEKKYMFYIVRTGIAPIDSRRLATFVDSTKLVIGVPVYFDSIYRTPSEGNPESFVWIRNSDNRFVWSSKDSLRIPYSQITGTPSIPSGTVTSIGLSSTDFSVSGSPVTTSGNITANLNTSGISAGNYGIVTVNTKGIATAGKRTETYSGTSNGSGVYTVTFGTAYSVAPNIQANLIGGTVNQGVIITVSTTGFTINAFQRNSINLLGADVLLFTTSALSGANIDVLITEK